MPRNKRSSRKKYAKSLTKRRIAILLGVKPYRVDQRGGTFLLTGRKNYATKKGSKRWKDAKKEVLNYGRSKKR